MAAEKIQFEIWRVDELLYDCQRKDTMRTYVGTTWAVSAKQAVSQFKFRAGVKPSHLYCDAGDSYSRETHYEAIPVL